MPRKKKTSTVTPPKSVPTPAAPQNQGQGLQMPPGVPTVPQPVPAPQPQASPVALAPPPAPAMVTTAQVQQEGQAPQHVPVVVSSVPGQLNPFEPAKLMDPFNAEVLQLLEMQGAIPKDVLMIQDISDPSGFLAQIPAKIGLRQYYSAMRDFAQAQIDEAKAAIETSVLLSGVKTYRVGRYMVRQNKDSAAKPKGVFNTDRAKEVALRYGVPIENGDLVMSLLKFCGLVPVDNDLTKSLMTHVGISKDDIEGCYDDVPSKPGAIVVTDLVK